MKRNYFNSNKQSFWRKASIRTDEWRTRMSCCVFVFMTMFIISLFFFTDFGKVGLDGQRTGPAAVDERRARRRRPSRPQRPLGQRRPAPATPGPFFLFAANSIHSNRKTIDRSRHSDVDESVQAALFLVMRKTSLFRIEPSTKSASFLQLASSYKNYSNSLSKALYGRDEGRAKA